MKKKILIVQFRHETNSFCPRLADEEAYRNNLFLTGDEVFNLRKAKSETGAFLNVLEERADFEIIPSVALLATPSGPVTKDVYDFVVKEVTEVIKRTGHIDAVLMNSHGGMVAQEHHDGEGDLIEIIRSLVGKDIPIFSTLDLHGNVTKKMADNATALVPYECYPHTDAYETAYFTAKLLEETLDGKVNPVMAYRRVPYLLPLFPSDFPQIAPIYDKAKDLQQISGVKSIRFTHGFFPSDIEEMGMAVLVITDGDKVLAEKLANILENTIKDAIPNLKLTYPTLDEALDRALLPGDGPVVIADASDNPGAGGIGDSTHILRRILERGIEGAAIATILDPDSVRECIKAGVGSTIELSLGGKSDPLYSGGPIKVRAYVKKLTDGKYIYKGKMSHGVVANHGKTAVVEIAGNTVLITSLPLQPRDIEIFISHGITPEDQKILVTKSAIHYRATFGPVAREMIAVSLPGYAVPVPDGFKFKNWKGNTI